MFEKVKSIRMAFCLLAISFLVLCGFVTSRDEKYVSYFLHLYSAGLFRERNFTLHKATASFGKDHINHIEMSFSCYKALPLENARKLVTSVAMDLLEKINNDPGLKEKGLVKEKFIPRQLHLRIICDNAIGENYQNNFIREIILDRGQLTYHTFKNMPEMWGKSYTIHEEFDYALMLVGSARPSEEVIAEMRIVPQMRAMPGDTSDFPSRRHEELLAPTPEIVKEQLEPRESAPSPIVPLKVAVEEISQLNLPPRKEPVIEEEVTPKAVDNAPPMPGIAPIVQPPQAPVVPPTLLAPEVLPVAPVETEAKLAPQEVDRSLLPQPVEKSAVPPQEAGVEAPVAPPSSSQMPERLKQAEVEGQKLLSRHDIDQNDVRSDRESEGADIPTLPETHIAESPENDISEQNDEQRDGLSKQSSDNQIDLFGLFDSFTSSFTAKLPEEEAAEAANQKEVIQDIALEQETSKTASQTPNTQNIDEDPATKEADAIFEQYERENNLLPQTQPNDATAPSKDAPQPPQAALQNEEANALVADNDSAEDSLLEKSQTPDDSTPPDQDVEMDEYQYSMPPEGSLEDNSKQVAVVDDVQNEAPKSWWQSLFSRKADAPQAALQNEQPNDLVADNDSAEDSLLEKSQTPDDSTPPDQDVEMDEYQYSMPPEGSLEDNSKQVAVVDDVQNEAPKSWWQSLFSSKAPVAETDAQDAEQLEITPIEPEIPVDAPQELAAADDVQETSEQVEVVEDEQTEAPKSWWQSLFSSKAPVAEADEQDAEQLEITPIEPEIPVDAPQELAAADDVQQTSEQVEVVEDEQAEAPKSWWQSLFSSKAPVAEADAQDAEQLEITPIEPELPVDAPQELAFADDVQQTSEQVEVVEDEQTEAPKSWWQSLFSTKAPVAEADAQDAEQTEITPIEPELPVDAPQEVAFADDVQETSEEVEVVEDEQIEAPKSWWQSLFSTKAPVAEADAQDAEQTEITPIEPELPVDAPQEVAFADDVQETSEQVEVVEDEQTEAPKSWWQSLFSTKAPAAEADAQDAEQLEPELPVDAPQELAAADDVQETSEQVEAAEDEQTEAPKSWWQSLFSTKAAVAEADEQDVEQIEPELPVDAQQELAFADDVQETSEQVEVVEDEQTEAPKSWWQSLFSTKATVDGAEEQDEKDEKACAPEEVALADSEVQQDFEESSQVVIIEEVQPAVSKSWWQTLFSTKASLSNDNQAEKVPAESTEDFEQQEHSTLQDGQDETSQEKIVFDSESSEVWWNRVFSVKDTTDSQPKEPSVESEASEIIAYHDSPEEIEVTLIDGPQNSIQQERADGLFFVPKMTREEDDSEDAAESNRLLNNYQQNDEIAALDSDDPAEKKIEIEEQIEQQKSDDDTVLELIQVEAQDSIDAQDGNSDPILRQLYSEPVSWMQAHSALPAEGTWEDEPQVLDMPLSDEPAKEIADAEIPDSEADKSQSIDQPAETEEDIIIYDTETLYEEEAP